MKTQICLAVLALFLSGCFPTFVPNGEAKRLAWPKDAATTDKLIPASPAPAAIVAPAEKVAAPVVDQAKAAVAKVTAAAPRLDTAPKTGEVTRAEATRHNAVVVAQHAYQYGVWCIIVGAVMCGIPALPTGPGYGVVGAGILLLAAGIFLPAYYSFIGYGILIGCAGWFIEHKTTNETWLTASAWLKSKFQKQPS